MFPISSVSAESKTTVHLIPISLIEWRPENGNQPLDRLLFRALCSFLKRC